MAETAVWPNFFLMNIYFALKGSKLFIIIWNHRFLQTKAHVSQINCYLGKVDRTSKRHAKSHIIYRVKCYQQTATESMRFPA